jgi:hypothetical protein
VTALLRLVSLEDGEVVEDLDLLEMLMKIDHGLTGALQDQL